MRVLFLGNKYNAISVACLQALVEAKDFVLSVGVSDPLTNGMWATARRLIRYHGFVGLVSRGMLLVTCGVRTKCRGMGIHLNGYRSLMELLENNSVEHFMCREINAGDSIARIKSISPELIVVAGFSQILRKEVLNIPSKRGINVHPSLLPKYRGPIPCYWVIKNNERVTGVTVHYLNEGIDSGDILLQREVHVDRGESHQSLERRLSHIGAGLLLEALDQIRTGTVQPKRQDENEATYFSFRRH